MSAEEEQIQLINDYLNNELSVADKHLFEQKLVWDHALAAETVLYRDMQAGIRISGRRDMKAHFMALEHIQFKQPAIQAPSTKPALSIQMLMWLFGIAACLIMGMITYIWFVQQHPQKLFSKYYTSYPNVIASIERGGSFQDEKSQAMQAYENGNYAFAIQKMEHVLTSHPQDVGLTFYLGMAFLENNELDKAIKQLEKAALQPPHDFSTQAIWYLSLAYVKNRNSRQAIPLLQTLIQENGLYSKRATQLLEEL